MKAYIPIVVFLKTMKASYLILLSFTLLCSTSMAKTFFIVKKIQVPVRGKFAGDMKFKTIPTNIKQIAEGALIEIGIGGKLDLEQYEAYGGQNPRKVAKLKFNLPGIIRLDRFTLRTYKTKNYPINTLLNVKKDESKPVNKKPILDLKNAFQRSMVELFNPDFIPKLKQDPEIKRVDTAVEVEKIKVLIPAYDSLYYMDGDSSQFSLVWEEVSGGAPYSIYVWKEGERKGSETAKSESNSYFVTIQTPGTYLLQVASHDRKYRSNNIRVSIDPQKFRMGKWGYEKDFLERRKKPSSIRPVTPANYLELYAKLRQHKIVFSWKDLANQPPYKLWVIRNGEVYSSETINERMRNMSLPPGKYEWFLERDFDPTKPQQHTFEKDSERSSFIIHEAPKNEQELFAEMMETLTTSTKDRIVYWDF